MHTGGRRAIEPAAAIAALLLFVIVGAAQGGAVRLVSHGANDIDAWRPVVWHVSGAIGAWAGLPIVLLALERGRRWPHALAVHALGWLGFTAVHVAVMLGLRELIGGMLGVDLSARGALAYQLVWEAQADLVLYPGLAAALGWLRARAARRETELHAARLEARLVEARLASLTARLDPHFLFNALNTVGAVMYEDLARSERMLASLGELLRAGLAADGPSWTLAEEQRHLEHYAVICHARFDERVRIRVHATASGTAIVPRLSIQGLVENAIKHNRDLARALTIEIDVRSDDRELLVAVSDDGVGFPEPMPAFDPGHGLGRLREILALLYGPRARIDRGRTPGGGARVELRLPSTEVA